MIKILSILQHNKDIVIEVFKSSPAWIALIISIISPLINKQLEIEKSKVNFLFSKRFDIIEKHFNKLYELRNATIELISTLMYNYENENITDVSKINTKNEILHNKWDEVKISEASLWLIADIHQVQLKESLTIAIKAFFKKFNSLSYKGTLELTKKDIEELITLAKKIQEPIAQTLEMYREVFSIK